MNEDLWWRFDGIAYRLDGLERRGREAADAAVVARLWRQLHPDLVMDVPWRLTRVQSGLELAMDAADREGGGDE